MKDLPENWIICMLNELLVSLESGSRPRGVYKEFGKVSQV